MAGYHNKKNLNMVYAASMTGLWCRFSVLPFLVIRSQTEFQNITLE